MTKAGGHYSHLSTIQGLVCTSCIVCKDLRLPGIESDMLRGPFVWARILALDQFLIICTVVFFIIKGIEGKTEHTRGMSTPKLCAEVHEFTKSESQVLRAGSVIEMAMVFLFTMLCANRRGQ